MLSRRSASKATKDYQNPKKNNQFSPSPIKRYNNQKSFNQSQSSHKQQANRDNKENLGFSKKEQSVTGGKRQKKPLQQLFSDVTNQHSANLSGIPNLEERLELTEKSKSQKLLPLDFTHSDNQQQMLNRELKSQIESQQSSKPSRRMEKSERKQRQDNLQSEGREFDSGHIEGGVHQSDNQQSSRKDQLTQQNKKQDNQSDSLMDATYHSAASGTTGGMQYSGRWTQEEHEKFLEGLKMYGKDWRQIEEHIGSRTTAQIRSHAQKYFNKLNREQQKQTGKLEKSNLGKRKREEIKKEPETAQLQIPQQIPSNIQYQTNQQVAQIHETLQKLAEDDTLITLRSLIAQREQVCFEFITRKLSSEETCKRLILITNAFHQAAMKSLQNCKFEICNRMIDERNLTQFICILLSKQITVVPDTSSGNQEIIQYVHTVASNQSQDSLQIPFGNFQGETHEEGETAKSSPQQALSQHLQQRENIKTQSERMGSNIKEPLSDQKSQ